MVTVPKQSVLWATTEKLFAYPYSEIESPINKASAGDLHEGTGSYVVDRCGNILAF